MDKEWGDVQERKKKKRGREWYEKRRSDTIRDKRLAAAQKEALSKHASRKEGRNDTIRGKRLAVDCILLDLWLKIINISWYVLLVLF